MQFVKLMVTVCGAAYPATPSNVAVVAAPVVKLAVPVQVPEIEKLSAEPADIRAL